MTGPDALINGQTYDSAPMYTDFKTGSVVTRMLMGARVNAGHDDYGLLSYRDWHGKWNELRVRPNNELDAGQYVKRNSDGWFVAKGYRQIDNNAARITNGLCIQGQEIYPQTSITRNVLASIIFSAYMWPTVARRAGTSSVMMVMPILMAHGTAVLTHA